jgi:hypothetical protein
MKKQSSINQQVIGHADSVSSSKYITKKSGVDKIVENFGR